MAPVLMNNCRRRDHAWHFGTGAFYDLLSGGRHAALATNIRSGDECIVATQDNHLTTVTFAWFKLSHEKILVDKGGVPCRVFFGVCIKMESMPKKKAAKAPLYSTFFDSRGHFKQLSIIPS